MERTSWFWLKKSWVDWIWYNVQDFDNILEFTEYDTYSRLLAISLSWMNRVQMSGCWPQPWVEWVWYKCQIVGHKLELNEYCKIVGYKLELIGYGINIMTSVRSLWSMVSSRSWLQLIFAVNYCKCLSNKIIIRVNLVILSLLDREQTYAINTTFSVY